MSKSKRRVKLMPAIREESSLNSGRIPVHIIPPGTKPPGSFNNSMIIQNLPEEPRKPPPKVRAGRAVLSWMDEDEWVSGFETWSVCATNCDSKLIVIVCNSLQ